MNTFTPEQVSPVVAIDRYKDLPILRRLDQSSGRHYYTVDPERTPALKFYPSWTTVIKRICGTSEYLVKWYADMGYAEAKRYMAERADYGTILHILLAEFMTHGKINLDHVIHKAGAYMLAASRDTKIVDPWIDDLKKDVLSFAAWMQEKEVEIEGVEVPMVSDAMGIAGTIDIICTLQFGKSRVRAIVDIKSGRKGFYPEHKYQLHGYMAMHNENVANENEHATMVFNWSPKDWQKSPTYNFENQTDAAEGKALPLLVAQYNALNPEAKPGTVLKTSGTLELNSSLSEFYKVVDVEEILKKYHNIE